MLAVAITAAVIGPWVAPFHYNEVDLPSRLEGPSWSHVFGTDELGRDLFSRVLYGARISLSVALGAVALSIVTAIVIGTLSGAAGSWVDSLIQRFVDGWMSFPTILMALTVLALFGSSLTNVTITVGLMLGVGQSRVIRSAVLGLKNTEWAFSARAIGAPFYRIVGMHIFPNVIPLAITLATLTIGQAILIEASLSFLGFGVPPPQPTWGGMLSGSGLVYMLSNPWIAVWPGVALGVVVFSANIVGDFVRDVLDPRLQ